MSSFLSRNAKISIESFPYRHLVVENFLEDELARAVRDCFDRSIEKAAPIGKVGEVGDLQYSALNYTPDLSDISSSAIGVFGSDDLRSFVCDIFGVRSNDCFMLGSHRHEPPSNDGWPHTDCAVVSYPRNGPQYNGFNVFQPDSGCVYADDSRDRQPDSLKVARCVACLYYHGNHDWQPGDGGETAIYLADKKTIAKRVPPIHNSLFAFEISPESFHGYLASPRSVRDTYIWWYHSDIASVVSRHRNSFDCRANRGVDPWDRWTGEAEAKYPWDHQGANS